MKIDFQILTENQIKNKLFDSNKIPGIINQFFPDQPITPKDIHNKIEPIIRESYQEILKVTDSSIIKTSELKDKLKENIQ